MDGGRGRRVGPLVPEVRAADRGRHQRRGRSPHHLFVAARLRAGVPRVRARDVDRGGTVVAWQPIAERLGVDRPGRSPSGSMPDADLRAEEIDQRPGETTFKLWWGRSEICEVRLAAPGDHNVLNALAALATCEAIGANVDEAAAALAELPAGRPALRAASARSAAPSIVDDYAHHPTEIAATLAAARALEPAAPGGGLPAAPLLAHARPSPRAGTGAGAGRRGLRARRLRGARAPEGRLAGVTGKLVADAAADAAGGPAGLVAADARRDGAGRAAAAASRARWC